MNILAKLIAPLRKVRQHEWVVKTIRLFTLTAVQFVLIGLLHSWMAHCQAPVPGHLFFLLLCTLSAGYLSWYLLKDNFFQQYSPLIRGLWLIGANCLGIIAFITVSAVLVTSRETGYYWNIYIPALFLFPLPWFFIQAFKHMENIPPSCFESIKIDNLKDIIGRYYFDNKRKGIIWEFEENFFELDPSGNYQFRTFVPSNVKVEHETLAQLFKGILSLHNHNVHPNRPVCLNDKKGHYVWALQYFESSLFGKRYRALDPHASLRENGINFRNSFSIQDLFNWKQWPIFCPRFKVVKVYITRQFIPH